MSEITPSDARARLVAGGVTGPHHSHSRQNTVAKARALVEGDPDGSFGLSGVERYSVSEVLSFLSELTGCSADVEDVDGFDTIDPDLTIAGILAAARRLAKEAARGATLLTVTGHPTGLLEHHIRVVDAYRRAGGKVLRLREEEQLSVKAGRHFEVRYVANVGCMADWGSLRHTHSAVPMEALLEGEPWPDIVLADHGFAGAAIERGIAAIAVMDINDPALAVARAEKKDVVIIPMDDNRPQRLYEPSWRLFEQVLDRGVATKNSS
jgi:hypothetical protein